MNNLPRDWDLVSLNELQADEPRAITDGPFGSHLTSAHYTEQGPRVVRLQNIGDGRFVDARAHISRQHFESLRAHEVVAGDLLVASLGHDPPRACLAPSALGPAIVKADCIRVRLKASVDPRWVMYALQTPAVRRWASNKMYGVGRPRLGLKTIRAIPVPLPPLGEQRRIVQILEDHLSRLDAASANVSSSLIRAQGWRRSATDRVVWSEGAEGLLAVADVLAEKMRNGHSARASTTGAGIRALTLTSVTRNSFTDAFTKIVTVDEERVRDLWLREGDILVQRSNTPELVGTTAIYRGPDDWAIFPDLLIRLRANVKRVSPDFLAAVMRTERAHRRLRSQAKGLAGSMPKIDQAAIGSLLVPVPSVAVQADVVSQVSDIEDGYNRLISEAQAAVRRVESLRRALLAAAFSGQL
ncbi:MAG: type restriction enzyme subunit [Frankiales bacterium]|nr:type restriction enzyme subunit [Frankiales bacterium]